MAEVSYLHELERQATFFLQVFDLSQWLSGTNNIRAHALKLAGMILLTMAFCDLRPDVRHRIIKQGLNHRMSVVDL